MQPPEVSYARSGDVAIAYQVVGAGSPDDGFRNWFVWHVRRSLSPGGALTSFRAAMELDVSDVLAQGIPESWRLFAASP